jgi:hypothetical protein
MRYFDKVKSRKTKEIYSVMLTYDKGNLDLNKSSCSCRFSSFYVFAGFWRRKKKVLCRHMLKTIAKLKKQKIIINTGCDSKGYLK